MIIKSVVPILAAQTIIAARRKHSDFLNVAPRIILRHCHFNNSHVERAAAQVVNQNRPVLLKLTGAITQCRRRRFIYQAQDVKPGEFARLFCCRAFFQTEISRHCDNDVFNRAALRLDEIFKPCKNQRADFGRRIGFAVELISSGLRLADFALDELNDAFAVRLDVFFSRLPDDDIVFIFKKNDAGDGV